MDEIGKLSQICPQQKNAQSKPADSTPHDIVLVVEDREARFNIAYLEPEISKITTVGQIPFVVEPLVVLFAGSIFCVDNNSGSGLVHEFDLGKRTTRSPTHFMKPLQFTAAAASSREIIVSGGVNKSWQAVAICSVYAPATNTWKSVSRLRCARKSHEMCWLSDGRVFAIGGLSSSHGVCLSSVEMLERAWISVPRKESSTEWKNVAPMKTARSHFSCCIVEGRIVVAGGIVAYGLSSFVEYFEPPTPTNTGQWTSLPNLVYFVSGCFLVPSAFGLVLIDRYCSIQLGRQKVRLASFDWDPLTWERRPNLTSFRFCWGMASLPDASRK